MARLLLLLLCLPSLALADIRTVIIDPGHGGRDLGGTCGKVYEKWLALDTALRLERALQRKGLRTVLTRRTDQFIPLQTRTQIANQYPNAIFVSIHYNFTWKSAVSGLETFYCRNDSRDLARRVQQGMLSQVRATNRGVKYARYYVIRNTHMPSILVEGGFVSNPRECRHLKDGDFRARLVNGIAQGIASYCRDH